MFAILGRTVDSPFLYDRFVDDRDETLAARSDDRRSIRRSVQQTQATDIPAAISSLPPRNSANSFPPATLPPGLGDRFGR